MMGSSLEAGLGDIFNAPDEKILQAVEKAGNRWVVFFSTEPPADGALILESFISLAQC